MDQKTLRRALEYVDYELSDFDLDKGYDELKSFCKASGITFACPVQRFRSSSDDLYLDGDMHFSARGHLVFAEALAPVIDRELSRSMTGSG